MAFRNRWAAWAAAMLLACGGGEKHSGVVSETTNGLAGRVVDAQGRGVAGARVSWRPEGFLPQEGPKSRGDTGSVLTGADGRYATGDLPKGTYAIEARSGGEAAALRAAAAGAAAVEAEAAVLAPTGKAVLRFAAALSGEVRVRAYGTDLDRRADARDTLVLDALAAAAYRLRVTSEARPLDVDPVRVAAGALTPVSAIDPAAGTWKADPPSKAALDSALARAFLEAAGALKSTTFADAVRRSGDRISMIALSGKALDSLPADVGALTFLDSLWINACGLKALPDTLFSLRNLKSLNLSYNFGVAPGARLGRLDSLVHLDLSGTSPAALDTVLRSLPRLADLRLNQNALGDLPAWVSALPALEILSCTECGLDSARTALIARAGMKQLFLTGNRLAAVPDAFTPAHALEKLFLDGNRLISLPPSLRSLGKLQILRLKGNSLCAEPAEMKDFIGTVPATDDPFADQTGC